MVLIDMAYEVWWDFLGVVSSLKTEGQIIKPFEKPTLNEIS